MPRTDYDPAKNYGVQPEAATPSQGPLLPRQVYGMSGSSLVDSVLPAGIFMPYAGAVSTIPSGWLLCNGQSVSRQSYQRLFAAIGTAYGSVDGSTFNVPDLQERVPVGLSAGSAEFGTLGATAGAKTHTLTAAEQASMPVKSSDFINQDTTGALGGFVFTPSGANNGNVRINAIGGGGAHNNIQPSITANYIIKY